MARISTGTYLRGRETMQRRELLFGVVREPPSPRFGHQALLVRLTVLLDPVARDRGAGVVCLSPMDVVLDEGRALVLQPDLMFISHARRATIRDRIYGAPDLVVEVISPSTARQDRGLKLRLYQEYGVRECWLVGEQERRLEVIAFSGGRSRRRVFKGDAPIQSSVMGALPFAAADVFGEP